MGGLLHEYLQFGLGIWLKYLFYDEELCQKKKKKDKDK